MHELGDGLPAAFQPNLRTDLTTAKAIPVDRREQSREVDLAEIDRGFASYRRPPRVEHDRRQDLAAGEAEAQWSQVKHSIDKSELHREILERKFLVDDYLPRIQSGVRVHHVHLRQIELRIRDNARLLAPLLFVRGNADQHAEIGERQPIAVEHHRQQRSRLLDLEDTIAADVAATDLPRYVVKQIDVPMQSQPPL